MAGANKRRYLIASVTVILFLASAIFVWRLFIHSHRLSLQEWVQEVKRPGDEELYAATHGSRYLAVLFHSDEIIVCDSEWTSNAVSTIEIVDKCGKSVVDGSRHPIFLTRSRRTGPLVRTIIDGVAYPIDPDSKEVRVIYSLPISDDNDSSGRRASELIDVEVSLRKEKGKKGKGDVHDSRP